MIPTRSLIDVCGSTLTPMRFRGKARLATLVARRLAYLSPVGTARVPGGGWLDVALGDRIQGQMWAGAYEPELVALLAAALPRKGVVLDVGAHIGYLSAVAAGAVGPNGTVHAFEPDQENYDALRRTAERIPTIQPWNIAVGDAVGTATLFRSPDAAESGWGSVLRPDAGYGTAVEVAATSLDAWSAARDLQRVDLLKIDAEGAEPLVLRGAAALLDRFAPTVVLESNAECLARAGATERDLVDSLRSARYRVSRLFTRGGRDVGTIVAYVGGRPACVQGRYSLEDVSA